MLGWRLEELRNSVNLSDNVNTLAACSTDLPLVSLTLPQGTSSSALPFCESLTSVSRFANLWASDSGMDGASSIPPISKKMSEGTWPTASTTPSSGLQSDPLIRSECSGGPNSQPQISESAYGLRFNGMDLPPLCSTPFPFVSENENCIPRAMSTSSPTSFATARSEISAVLNGSCIDSSFLSDNSIWSPIPQACQPNPFNPYLTPKQAILCLQLVQDFHESGNCSSVPWDAGQRAHANTLTSILQQHLLSVLLSPSPTSPTMASSHSVNNDNNSLERAARFHREVAGLCDVSFTWSGQLPPRNHRNPVYSCKVFLGGVPWDITEFGLMHAFKQFGNVKIEWPGKDGSPAQPKGYVYIVFENEKQVKTLLQNCTHDYGKGGNWYFKISSKKMRAKDVQVIPWALCDSNYVRCQTIKLDPQKTIFVGALHGMLNAEGLATIIQDLFSGVVYAGIDTDRYKYPIGSGRVTFNNNKSYMKAVSAAFVEIRTSKFTKKVQVDPYLEDATCSKCGLQQGLYFCRDLSCFRYFCRTCFQYHHSGEGLRSHRPLLRNSNKPHGNPGSIMSAPFNASCAMGHGNSFGSVQVGRSFCDLASTPYGNGSRTTSRFPR